MCPVYFKIQPRCAIHARFPLYAPCSMPYALCPMRYALITYHSFSPSQLLTFSSSCLAPQPATRVTPPKHDALLQYQLILQIPYGCRPV